MKHPVLRDILIAGSISIVILIIMTLNTDRMDYDHRDFNKYWDHHSYIAMASSPILTFHIASYSWRILNPFLAKVLPFGLDSNFLLLSIVGLWLASIILFLLFLFLGFSRILSLSGMLLFLSTGWATKFNLYDYWLTDPLLFVFLIAAILSLYKKNYALFTVLLTCGVLVKEAVIFLAPLYFTFNRNEYSWFDLFVKNIIIVLPAIIVLILIRVLIPDFSANQDYLSTLPNTLRHYPAYDLKNLFAENGIQRINNFNFTTLKDLTIGTYGLTILVFPLFSFKKNIKVLIRFWPFIALTYFSLFFITDTERILVILLPVLIIMTLNGVVIILKKLNEEEKLFIIVPLFLIFSIIAIKPWIRASLYYECFILSLVFLLLLLRFIIHEKTLIFSRNNANIP